MPEIYISTSCLNGTRNLRKILEVYSAYGIVNVELSGGLEYVQNVVELLSNYPQINFIIHNYFPPPKEPFIMNLAAQNEKVRGKSVDVCKSAIDICHRFGCGLYSFHPGFRVESTLGPNFDLSGRDLVPYDAAFSKFTRSIEEISAYAKRTGLRVALENLEHQNEAYMMTRPAEFAQFQEIFPDVGVLLDLGHLKIASKRQDYAMEDFIRCVRENLFEVHIHENDGKRDLHREPMSGELMSVLGELDCEIITLESRGLTLDRIFENVQTLEKVLE